jgi:hypothetical protein
LYGQPSANSPAKQVFPSSAGNVFPPSIRSCCQPIRGVAVALIAALLSGCAAHSLDSARRDFYRGRFDAANRALSDITVPQKDMVLLLMERGTIRQALGYYAESAEDFIQAADILEQLEVYSLSRGATSLVVNDSVQNFRGTPYERTLLHTLTTIDHFSDARWNDAGVEARRIIDSLSPEVKQDYPDEAFSRYVAGFGLEVANDPANAEVQYRKASALASGVTIDEKTGRLCPTLRSAQPDTSPAESGNPGSSDATGGHELVCFILLGSAPPGNALPDHALRGTTPAYAEIYSGDMYLGRSYNLTDTHELAFVTEQKEATRKALKILGRIAVKETIAEAVASKTDNRALGDLIRLILIGLLERPDIRRWETLPRWLQVARVQCPANLAGYRVVLRTSWGAQIRSVSVKRPITRYRNTFVSFLHDIH